MPLDRQDDCLHGGLDRRVWTSVVCGALAVIGLFDKVRLEARLPDGGEVGVRRFRACTQTGSAHAYLVHLRARHLIQGSGYPLHAGSAVHALDLESKFLETIPVIYPHPLYR